MIGTAFAPEPMPSIEALRVALDAPRTSHFERIMYRCHTSYHGALNELHARSVEDANVIRACMEALLSASACMLECGAISSDPGLSRTLGNVAAYGFVQSLAQIIEAVTGLEKSLGLDVKTIFTGRSTMKERDYWKFRNRHTHVVDTHKSNRGPDDPKDANHHVFRLGRTDARHIHYVTLSSDGFLGRSMSTERVAWELQSDLGVFFDATLAAVRARPER